MVQDKRTKKPLKFWRYCKLPTCAKYSKSTGKKFGTNRGWQEFCCPEHQQEWHRYLRHKRDELIVELEIIKEASQKAVKSAEACMKELKRIKAWLLKEFQLGGTPQETNERLKKLEGR